MFTTSSSPFNSLLGFAVLLQHPMWKLKNYFKRQPFFFPSGKAVQVFHIIVLTISCGKRGASDDRDWSMTEVPKERFPQRKMIAVGTPAARSTATSSWLQALSFRCPLWGDRVSSAASPSHPQLISCSPRRCRRGWWPGCRWGKWGCIQGRWGCTWSL